MANGNRSQANPLLVGAAGFFLGAGLVMWFLYFPTQRLLRDREEAITKWSELNRQEQERLREIRDVSTSEMIKWISAVEKTNTQFQKIQQTLNDQEKALATPGTFYITLIVIIAGLLIGLYIWLYRLQDVRDAATLENFETFIAAKLRSIESSPTKPTLDLDTAKRPSVLPESRTN